MRVLLLSGAADVDLPQPADGFAFEEAIPVHPQQFTESRCITPVGLAAFAFLRLNEDDLVAPVIPQHPNQPVVEPAHFDDRDELFIPLSTTSRELIEEHQKVHTEVLQREGMGNSHTGKSSPASPSLLH
ncbi:hypothetical protein SH661x_002617 [Planctomicrobium sp. SH661]|uniref:hypothetical protein n=1 Tax=Planctomicrobium sp. SH661 TaxID=3448124 RepID=UPI003F5B5D7A